MKLLIGFSIFLAAATVSYSQNIEWTQTYNGKGDNRDQANCIYVDGTGNSYVAGYTFNRESDKDFITVKYDPNGAILWSKTYTSLLNMEDEVNDIVVDASGNVYVTGSADNDYVTIKYNSEGTMIWTMTYSFAGKDAPSAIDVDASGNIYVTGKSDGDPTALKNYDYATIKYNSAGVQMWVQRWDGGTDDDEAIDLKVDGSGNIIITGTSEDGLYSDFITIKYDQNGVKLWEARYDGTLNLDDKAVALAFDASGNIYVCGKSDQDTDPLINSYDIITVKYSSAGSELWTAVYSNTGSDQPSDIAVDASGNVYLSGSKENGVYSDFITLKYNSSGILQWSQSFNGVASQNDDGVSVAVDNAGNVYICGESDNDNSTLTNNNDIVTIKYDANGQLVWSDIVNGTGDSDDLPHELVLDANGDIYVTGESIGLTSQEDIFTTKYNSAGVVQWATAFNGVGDFSDRANSIFVDDNDNIYVAGYSMRKENDLDFMTIKYDSTGSVVWEATNNSGSNGLDEISCITVDNSGNTYVSGIGNEDYYTIKYTVAGDTAWTARYDGLGGNIDEAKAIAVDLSGNVYVTGLSDRDVTSGINDDYATVKYNSSGVQQWSVNYNGLANGKDRAADMLVDGSGNVCVTGRSNNGNDDDIVTIKYNSSGTQLWSATYDRGWGHDRASVIKSDASGNIYVAGKCENALDYDIVVVKYSSSGVQGWAYIYDGGYADVAEAIQIDNDGNIYVCGSKSGVLYNDYLVLKIASAGNLLWSATYNGTGGQIDDAVDLAVDMFGNVYVCGESDNNTDPLISNRDYSTLMYSPTGTQVWLDSHNGTENGIDEAKGIALDSHGNIYVTGFNNNTLTQKDVVTIKYSSADTTSGILSGTLSAKGGILIYPNPFLESSTIEIINDNGNGDKCLYIYDVNGRLVEKYTQMNSREMLDGRKFDKGIYFYLYTVNNQQTDKGRFIVE